MLTLSRRLLLVPVVLLLVLMASLVRSSPRLALRLRPASFTHPRQFRPIGLVDVPGAPIGAGQPMAVVDVPVRSFFSDTKHTQLDFTGMSAKSAVETAISADKV